MEFGTLFQFGMPGLLVLIAWHFWDKARWVAFFSLIAGVLFAVVAAYFEISSDRYEVRPDPVVSENANGVESSNPRAREQQKLKEANRIAEMERQERLKLQREMEELRRAQEQEQEGTAAKEQAASNDVLDTLEVGTRRERKVILVGGFSGVQANHRVEIVIEPPMAATHDYKWEVDGCPNVILGGTAGPRFRFVTGDKGICIIRLSSTCKAFPSETIGCVSDVRRRPYRLPIREPVRS